MQLILQISTHDFLELDELCESVKKATNEKITVTNYIELMIQEELMMKNELMNELSHIHKGARKMARKKQNSIADLKKELAELERKLYPELGKYVYEKTGISSVKEFEETFEINQKGTQEKWQKAVNFANSEFTLVHEFLASDQLMETKFQQFLRRKGETAYRIFYREEAQEESVR